MCFCIRMYTQFDTIEIIVDQDLAKLCNMYSRCNNTSNANQNKQNQISNNYQRLPAEHGQKPLLAIVAEDLLQIVVATQMEAVLVGTADTEDWCPECFCNIEDIPFTNVRCLSNEHNRMSNFMMSRVLEFAIRET